MIRACLLSCLALFLATPERLGADVRFCVPDPAVRRSLLEFENLLNRCGRRAECWEKERAVLESALETHPTDPHLHRAYQDLFKRWTPSDRSVELRDLEPWYRGLVEREPEEPTYLYAYGRYIDDARQARALFERAVAADPDFPWGHVGLAFVSASDGDTRDLEKLKQHLGRFIVLCPSRSKVALSYAPQIDDAAFWQENLPRLRAALSQEPVAGTYIHYAQIWQLELANLPRSAHPQVHERIAADLERIATLELWDNAAWTATLEGGYLLLGDDEKLAWIGEQVMKHQP